MTGKGACSFIYEAITAFTGSETYIRVLFKISIKSLYTFGLQHDILLSLLKESIIFKGVNET
jgi:hypothetical protein